MPLRRLRHIGNQRFEIIKSRFAHQEALGDIDKQHDIAFTLGKDPRQNGRPGINHLRSNAS